MNSSISHRPENVVHIYLQLSAKVNTTCIPQPRRQK